MRSLFFIMVILAVIATALYFKFGNPFSKKDTVNKPFENDPIATKWDSILPGKWNIVDIGSNSRERWEDTMDIEFYGEHKFRLNATEYYYNLQNYGGSPAVYLVVGGGSIGEWRAINDSSFTLYGQDCAFNTSKGNGLYEDKVRLMSCANPGFAINYGTISNLTFKSEIETLTRDSIFITGKSYSRDFNVSCLFTRE